MNLATRCHACGTVFRVVRDQLRVSEGWVRCGRCMAVFNATDDLFELDADATDATSPSATTGDTARRVLDELEADRRHLQAQASAMPMAWTQPARPAEGLHDAVFAATPAAGGQGEIQVHAAAPTAAPTTSLAAAPAAWPQDDELAPADAMAAESDQEPGFGDLDTVPADDGRPAAIVAWTPHPPDPNAIVVAPDADEPAPLPSFVRRADRAAFWRSPRMRAGLGGGAALLLAALALQIGHAARDPLAAHWPELTPALEALCEASGCSLAPLRRIELLSVDSAGLTLLDGAPMYRLQVVLHNRAGTALLVPALELSLEDAQGALVARRVLQGAELGLASPVVAAGTQLPLTVTLAARDRRIAGYHVELFYP